MKEWILVAVVLILIFAGSYLVPDFVKDYEVIEPVKGIKCVVVSRLMHTSVDCWKDYGIPNYQGNFDGSNE